MGECGKQTQPSSRKNLLASCYRSVFTHRNKDFSSSRIQAKIKSIRNFHILQKMETQSDQEDIDFSERWDFIKTLPHKYIRDIAFIIASPHLLSDSEELPLVSDSLLGGDKNSWAKSKKWLKTLDVQSVERWIVAKKKGTRLGDYFATCVEYILHFSPFFQAKELLVSQPIMQELKPSDGISPKKKGKKIRVPSKTIGEFDFLFQLSCSEINQIVKSTSAISSTADMISSKDVISEPLLNASVMKEVRHWEVSVKFLLYTGPWEVFGIKTPVYATWKLVQHNKALNGNSNTELTGEKTCTNTVTDHPTGEHCAKVNCLKDRDMFLGCYLGPHVGETLVERKTRLQCQLALSENPLASSFLQKAYITEDDLKQTEDKGYSASVEPKKSSLSVIPAALLKGYLFYEYKLWCTLVKDKERKGYGSSVSHSQCGEETSELNPDHWIGWWVHLGDFSKFASLPAFDESKWYVVPKLDWLSPVIVNSSTANGSAKVMGVDELLSWATGVADKATSAQMGRRKRFMVAEVTWDAAFMDCSLGKGTSSRKNCGAWVEVSRGFVVEETWPDSKTYMTCGYNPDWTPCLPKIDSS